MKYRLIWQKSTPLDLSQILDDRGRPVVFIGKGAKVTIDAITYKHPLIQKYCGNGLEVEVLDPTPSNQASNPKETSIPQKVQINLSDTASIKETSAELVSTKKVLAESTIPSKKYYRTKRIKRST